MSVRDEPLVKAVLAETERLNMPSVARYIVEAEQAKALLRSVGFGVMDASLLHAVQEAVEYIREKQNPRPR